ncbi:MAG TPA: hypothetical protein VFZ19_06385 [Solirubrobacterales bacterium]
MGVVAAVAFSEDRRFFELAATIMPILLFGSIIAKAFQPPDLYTRLRWHHGVRAIAICLYIAYVAIAEVFAIAVAIDGEADETIRIGVSLALVLAIFNFGWAVTIPWAIRFWREGQLHWVASTLAAIAILLTFAWGSFKLLEFATEAASESSKFEHAETAAEDANLHWIRAKILAHRDGTVGILERKEIAILERRKVAARQYELSLLPPSARPNPNAR